MGVASEGPTLRLTHVSVVHLCLPLVQLLFASYLTSFFIPQLQCPGTTSSAYGETAALCPVPFCPLLPAPGFKVAIHPFLSLCNDVSSRVQATCHHFSLSLDFQVAFLSSYCKPDPILDAGSQGESWAEGRQRV